MLQLWTVILLTLILVCFVLLARNKAVSKYFLFFLFVAFFMWYVTPNILTYLGIHGVLDFLEISEDDYYSLMIKELSFLIAILFIFNLLSFRKKIRISRFILTENLNYRKQKVFNFFLYTFLIFYIIYLLINQMDYVANNDILNQEGGLFQILSFFSSYLVAYLWVNIIFSESDDNKKIYILFALGYALALVLTGSRIYLLSFVFFGFFMIVKQKSKIKKTFSSLGFALILITALFLLPFISSKRSGADLVAFQSADTMSNLVLEELNVKLNSTAYSVILLKYDGEGFAGYNPYIGSFLKFIPRFVWEDKPTATSFNSSITGIPSRRIPVLLGSKSDTFNTGTSPYAVSAWQDGTMTILISIFLNVILFILINRCFLSNSFLIKSFGFLLIGFPQLVMLPTTGDNIIQKLIEAFIIFATLLFLGYFKFIKRYETFIPISQLTDDTGECPYSYREP